MPPLRIGTQEAARRLAELNATVEWSGPWSSSPSSWCGISSNAQRRKTTVPPLHIGVSGGIDHGMDAKIWVDSPRDDAKLTKLRHAATQTSVLAPARQQEQTAEQKEEEEEGCSLQLSPFTPSPGSRPSAALSTLSSLPSPLRPGGSFHGFVSATSQDASGSSGGTAACWTPRGCTPGGEGFWSASPSKTAVARASPPPLLSTLRQRATLLSQRLLRRERQCLALKEALESCGGSEGARFGLRPEAVEQPYDAGRCRRRSGGGCSSEASSGSGCASAGCKRALRATQRQPLRSCENTM